MHVWGEYPRLILKMFERKGIHVEMLPEDAATLKAGCVDFVSCSYYMTMTESVDPNAERTPRQHRAGCQEPVSALHRLGLADRPPRACATA